jgi:hypothetical protein
MIVAIDFDGTYTADPKGWGSVVDTLLARGHTVVCATGNAGKHVRDEMGKRFAGQVAVVVGKPKHVACLEIGLSVDVWIDNEPLQSFMSQEEMVVFLRDRGFR